MSLELLARLIIAGIVMGALYALMAIGITFIYSIMKLINWAMGEFYMMGSFVQYVVVVFLVGSGYWYLGIPISMAVVFIFGVIVQRLVIKPMFERGIERRAEYATIVTVSMVLLLRGIATVLNGPRHRSPGHYLERMKIGPLAVDGDRVVACVGAVVIMVAFYLVLKKTWIGMALRAAADNRTGVQTAGIHLEKLDQIAFGIGVALAAGAGALLAPVFLVHPNNGAITTMKGFEIIIIGGLGSIPGALIAGLALGLVESLGGAIDPRFSHVYGFAMLLLILVIRPTGLFGEHERIA